MSVELALALTSLSIHLITITMLVAVCLPIAKKQNEPLAQTIIAIRTPDEPSSDATIKDLIAILEHRLEEHDQRINELATRLTAANR